MPKLVYIFNGRLPTEKAHGLQITKMCEAFAGLGVNTELLLPFRANPIKDNLFSYYRVRKDFVVKRLWSIDPMAIKWFPGRLAFFIQSATSGISIIFYLLTRRYPKDTLFYSRDYVSLFILSFLGFKPVAEIHDYRFSKPRGFLSFILKRVKKIITNSEGTLSLLHEHYNIPGEKSLVAPNGVDVGFFNIKETREEAREILNLPPDKIIVGYVGRFNVAGQDKGVPSLVKAFERLRNRDKADLLLVGGPELSVPYSRVPLYLRAIDIAVIPMPERRHATTTSPLKLFEYMAAGKAIVIAETSDIEELRKKIDALLEKPERIKEFGELNKAESKKHSWSQRAGKIFEFLKNV